MTIACASQCTQRDRHLADCPCADPQHEHGTTVIPADQIPGYSPDWPADVEGLEVTCGCTGCLPKLAAPRLAVCPGCEHTTRDGLAELPDLWVDLAERPRLAGVSKAPTSEGDTPDPMSDPRRQERSAIKAMLVSWCLTLAEDHSINVPNEAGIAAVTRRLAAWHSDQARQARDAANLLDMPTTGPLHRDQIGAAVMRRHAAESAEQARLVRDDRETDRDILRAICEHITRHADRLLADLEHAGQLVSDVKNALRSAKGSANRARPTGIRIPCPECGHRTRVTAEQESVSCPACGAHAAVAIWSGDTAAPPAYPALEEDIAAWMLASHRMEVKGPRIRQWASRGKLESVVRDDGRVGYDALVVCDLAYQMQAKRAS